MRFSDGMCTVCLNTEENLEHLSIVFGNLRNIGDEVKSAVQLVLGEDVIMDLRNSIKWNAEKR